MAFFKKKKEDDGYELPELPSFSEMKEIKEVLRAEPEETMNARPLLAMQQVQQEVKRAPARFTVESDTGYARSISDTSFPDVKNQARRELISMPQVTSDIEQIHTSPMEEDTEDEIQMSRSMATMASSGSSARGPIFVKIDKFREASNSFDLIKRKISELDLLLKKSKDLREQERQEFDAWEQEISDIKDKVRKIEEKLFAGLD